MRIFKTALLLGWFVLFFVVAMEFIFPKFMTRIMYPFAPYFQLVPIYLALATLVYGALRIYLSGMRRNSTKKS